MIDTDALRKKIIDYGISGKLTRNLALDGNVEELLAEIEDEKSRLIREGKIKKEKKLPEIVKEEVPFDIPETWRWIYLGEIFSHNTGKALNNSNTEGIPLEYITTSNMYWDHFELESLKTMLFKESEIEKCTIRKGDLLICEGGDIGRSAIWDYDYEMRIQNHIHRLRGYGNINHKFYYYVMRKYKDSGLIDGRGIGLQGFSSKRVHTLVVPIPPLEEQKKIVEILDELLAQIDVISDLQDRYTNNLSVLKSKIIDAGIQGKLTRDLSLDGNVEDLLAEIKEEKKRLIKEGKIKKEKKLPVIAKEEIPFDIPTSWKWVRLRDICKKIVDGDHNPPAGINSKSDYMMLSAQNINDDQLVNLDRVRYLSKDVFSEEDKRTQLEKGDVLLTIVATLGRSCVYRYDYNVCFQRSVCVISTFINPDYLKRVLDSSFIQKYMVDNATGAAQPGFYLNKVEKLCIPVPPLEEQQRIVEKINAILLNIK